MEIPENLTEAMLMQNDLTSEANKENSSAVCESTTDLETVCFTFSNCSEDQREKFSNFVHAQGAKTSSASNYCDPESTHVIGEYSNLRIKYPAPINFGLIYSR